MLQDSDRSKQVSHTLPAPRRPGNRPIIKDQDHPGETACSDLPAKNDLADIAPKWRFDPHVPGKASWINIQSETSLSFSQPCPPRYTAFACVSSASTAAENTPDTASSKCNLRASFAA